MWLVGEEPVDEELAITLNIEKRSASPPLYSG
jgi:hypothetical protein